MREPKRAVKPRASRLAGSARGRASRIGEAESGDTNKTSWANKENDGKRSKHSTKAEPKSVKHDITMTRKFGGKQRRGGKHGGSKPPPYKNRAGNSQKKRVLNSREQHSPCAGDELPACASRTAERLRRSVIAPKDKHVKIQGTKPGGRVGGAHSKEKHVKVQRTHMR